MRCERCAQIFSGSCRHRIAQNHYFNLRQVEQAASRGCYICHVLWGAMLDKHPELMKTDSIVSLTDTISNWMPVTTYQIWHKARDDEDNSRITFSIQMSNVATDLRTIVKFGLQETRFGHIPSERTHTMPSSTWSESMTTAVEWLSSCLNHHRRCCVISSSDDYVPKRLLALDNPAPDKIRLVMDPGSKLVQTKYATLSHCWGTSKFLTLTSDTSGGLQAGIRLTELPQTFQEGISVSRCLGIRYVWIDSLCIFQDSKADWAEQAPQMSQIYRNAVVNIAMSAAANGNKTCFRERDLSQIKPCIVQTSWEGCSNDKFYVYSNKIWEENVESKPLLKRGWVFQELLLPPRILYLTGHQLFWECFELTACESYPSGLPQRDRVFEMPKERLWPAFNCAYNDNHSPKSTTKASTRKSFWMLWIDIVRMFTGLALTMPFDRLVAVAGIAKAIGLALDDNYCAGIWRETLVVELCWNLADCRRPKPRSGTYRAPSWSWASVDGQCIVPDFINDEHIEKLIKVHDIRIETVTDDPFGVVNAGILTIDGWLATIRLKIQIGSTNEKSVFFNGTWLPETSRPSVLLDSTLSHEYCHCMPVILFNGLSSNWTIHCLLLAHTNGRRGQFQRVGILIFEAGGPVTDCAMFQNLKNEEWLEYEARLGGGKYRISVL